MGLKDCNFCKNDVPKDGQCNGCGFVDGFNRPPTDEEFVEARGVNDKHKYEQFRNIDSVLLELTK